MRIARVIRFITVAKVIRVIRAVYWDCEGN
jgi:hypothetical protein